MDRLSASIPSQRDLLTVDLRGLKPALTARATMSGLSVGALVRKALSNEIARDCSVAGGDSVSGTRARDGGRVSLRLTRPGAEELQSRARHAGLSLGRYVVALMRLGVEPPNAQLRRERLAVLIRSNAELSATNRNVAYLAALLEQGSVEAAQAYVATMKSLTADIRAHLELASEVLAAEASSRRWPRGGPNE